MTRTLSSTLTLGGVLLFSAFCSAASFGSGIQGHVYDLSHQAVGGVEFQLYIDNGDGVFNSADAFTGRVTSSDQAGRFSFTDLDPATSFFVMQPSQTIGGINLPPQSSALESPGRLSYIIDSFEITQSLSADPIAMSRSSGVSGPNNSIMGGQRDAYVQLLSGRSHAKLRVNPFTTGAGLQFDNSAGVTSMAVVTWDGIDNSFDMSPAAGLRGMDLTDGGLNDSFAIRMAIDRAGAGQTVKISFFSDDATSVSTIELPIPVTSTVEPNGYVYASFADFVGNADPSRVDAIQLMIEGRMPSIDAKISEIGIAGPRQLSFTIPEPTTGLLLLLGLCSAVYLRSRSR